MADVEENNRNMSNSDNLNSNMSNSYNLNSNGGFVTRRAGDGLVPGKWITYILCLSLVALISSLVSIIIGVYVEYYDIVPTKMISSYLTVPCIILMVLGACLAGAAVFAFRSAKFENMIHLKWCARAVLLLIFISLGTASYVCSTSFFSRDTTIVHPILNGAIENYQNPIIMNRVGSIQKALHCCGMDSIDDWNMNDFYFCSNINHDARKCSVPYTCCVSNQTSPLPTDCGKNVLNTSSPVYVQRKNIVYVEGCQKKIERFLSSTAKELLYTFLFQIICQILVYRCSENIMDIFKEQLNLVYPPIGYLEVAGNNPNDDL